MANECDMLVVAWLKVLVGQKQMRMLTLAGATTFSHSLKATVNDATQLQGGVSIQSSCAVELSFW